MRAAALDVQGLAASKHRCTLPYSESTRYESWSTSRGDLVGIATRSRSKYSSIRDNRRRRVHSYRPTNDHDFYDPWVVHFVDQYESQTTMKDEINREERRESTEQDFGARENKDQQDT